jgi:hypothetical protein
LARPVRFLEQYVLPEEQRRCSCCDEVMQPGRICSRGRSPYHAALSNGGGGWYFQGLVLDPGAVTKPPAPQPIIEFVGDSITCGSPAPIEAAGNYTWLTAEALGCDHTQISWPGRSLMTGFGFQDDKVGLDIQYFHQYCFYG